MYAKLTLYLNNLQGYIAIECSAVINNNNL